MSLAFKLCLQVDKVQTVCQPSKVKIQIQLFEACSEGCAYLLIQGAVHFYYDTLAARILQFMATVLRSGSYSTREKYQMNV